MKTITVNEKTHKTMRLLCAEHDVRIIDMLDVLLDKMNVNKDNFGVFSEIKKRKENNE